MAVQTETIQLNVQLGRGSTANERVLAEVGDTITVIVQQADNTYVTDTVTLTYVDHIRKIYGWDANAEALKAGKVVRVHHKHTMLCS